MSIYTPVFEMEVPSPATKAKDLGAELLAFGLSVDQTLAQFDYNGADPDLVLSRVAILEAWRASIVGQVEALDQQANYRSGTRAQRLAATKRAGMLWQETDQQQQLWSIDPNGAWRLQEGVVTSATGAFSGSAPIVFASPSLTVPTVIGTDEHIELWVVDASVVAYLAVSTTAHARNPSNTVLTVPVIRVGGVTTSINITYGWRIVKAGA